MNRYRFVLFIFFLLLAGCSSQTSSPIEDWSNPSDKIKVLSTTALIDDIVGQIGKERISHIALIAGEVDPHSYELVKGDDEKLSIAQLIFYNGLGLEHGASLRYQLQTHSHAISLGDHVLQSHPEKIVHVGKEIDPHIWMDISIWSEIITPIVSALSDIDPKGASFYQTNGEILREKMVAEHKKIYTDLQAISQTKRYLVTSHDAFNYFARAYLATPSEVKQNEWENRFEAPEGLAPDGQLSASDIQKIVDHLISYQIQVIFPESNVSRDSLKKVVHACAHKGLKVILFDKVLYGDALGPIESEGGTYLNMIRYDADVLNEAWQR